LRRSAALCFKRRGAKDVPSPLFRRAEAAGGRRNIINFAEEDIFERIKEISGGEGADVVLDCVGMEASPVMGRAVSSAT
jgi:threonine dehydrogenase-like Zn-dependent dehydrogenase